MAIFLETIGATTFEIYGGLAAALTYADETYSPQMTAWLGLSADDQKRTLRTATRYLDTMAWDGDATGLAGSDATTLAFPRSGLYRDGAPVDPTTVPHEVTDAVVELAVAIAAKPALTSTADQGSNLRSVSGGGGVSVDYFAPTSAALGTATVLPVQVQRLVGRFLATAGGDSSFGSSGKRGSEFARRRVLSLVWPED